jgi:hypothetical protein
MEAPNGWVPQRQASPSCGQNAADRKALGVGWYRARYLCMLAAAYARVGQAEPGLRVTAEAKDLVAQ